LSDSDYLVTVESGSELAPDALVTIRRALARFPGTDFAYGDSIDASGTAMLPRPEFSPVRLRAQDYLGGVRVFRAGVLREVGQFRSQFEGCETYEAALRLTARGCDVLHIPVPLAVSDDAVGVGIARLAHRPHREDRLSGLRVQAVEAHLRDLNIVGSVQPQEHGGFRLRYPVDGSPLVSLIIPTRGGSARIAGQERVLVVEAVRGIVERSTYRNFELVIVADDATPQTVVDELVAVADARLRLVRWSEPFNFSAKINRGAVLARGDFLVPLNDDIELISPDWLEALIGLAQQADIGLVGTTLFFEDGSVQHAGHLYVGGAAGHVGLGWQPDWDDRLASMSVDREVSGVTAACAMLRAETFWEVGGFSGLLPGNYNDADFAMKIRRAGKSVVWTPHAKLYHFESKTRVATIAPYELSTIRSRWSAQMQLDPFWPEVVR
jgi:GT2 family glycosyltransferase